MVSNFRQSEILMQARKDGKVRVDALAQHYNVTVQTIRRDLSELADLGRLERVHGGAVIPSSVVNLEYEDRRQMNDSGKRDIALACAEMIPDDAAIFMNIGTSTEAVAIELLGHKNLLVVTNNLNIASILSANKSFEIVVTGGILRRADRGLIGTPAADSLGRYKFDYSILGCSALDHDGDVLDFDAQEVLVSQTAIQRARNVVIVADQQKFKRKAPLKICSLADVSTLITDGDVDAQLVKSCADWNTDIAVV